MNDAMTDDELEIYPLGTRVQYAYLIDGVPSATGKVVAEGPTIFGTTECAPGHFFVEIEHSVENMQGKVAPAGTIFMGNSKSWRRIDDD